MCGRADDCGTKLSILWCQAYLVICQLLVLTPRLLVLTPALLVLTPGVPFLQKHAESSP